MFNINIVHPYWSIRGFVGYLTHFVHKKEKLFWLFLSSSIFCSLWQTFTYMWHTHVYTHTFCPKPMTKQCQWLTQMTQLAVTQIHTNTHYFAPLHVTSSSVRTVYVCHLVVFCRWLSKNTTVVCCGGIVHHNSRFGSRKQSYWCRSSMLLCWG